MNKKLWICLHGWLLLTGGSLFGQVMLPGGGYQGMSFPEFVESVEQRSAVRFYFLPDQVAGIRMVQLNDERSLENILSISFKGNDLSFFIRDDFQVFVWSGAPIRATLPPARAQALGVGRLSEEMTELEHVPATLDAGPQRREEVRVGEDNGASKAVLSGYVRDMETGTPIAGASVAVPARNTGIYTDEEGYFTLTLPTGTHELSIRSFGKSEVIQPVRLRGEGVIDVDMEDAVRELDEVVIEAARRGNVDDVQMGTNQLSIQSMKQMPALLGEVDVIRSAILLPGVQSVGEGSGGFNVRGGGVDQNLVLLEQAPVFNPNHMFGFFSAFHPDLVSDFTLYKSGIPARYGGRISSVFDVGIKDGNRKKYELRGGISPITARLSLEGPIIKNKGSFVIGGRSTYSNWLLSRLPDAGLRNSSANFYDLNLAASYDINLNNRIDVSAYTSSDRFVLNGDTAFAYQNRNGSISWKHLFSPDLYGVFSAVYSSYAYQVTSESTEEDAYELGYDLGYAEAKADMSWLKFTGHHLRFGASAIRYVLNPGYQNPLGAVSLVQPEVLQTERALESALYLSDEWRVNERLSISGGLRYSFFAAYGPRDIYEYGTNAPKEISTITDTIQVAKGSVIQTYQGPEFRLAIRLSIDESSSVKASYNRMRQYLHRVSNTISISPTDTWKLSDRYIRPQVGDQYAIGYFRNFRQNTIETSVELYYKPFQNIIDYKGGADLLLNSHLETELLNATGKAYGIELMISKNSGRLNGWISYTYARTFVQVDGPFIEEKVNRGELFPANFDKPHDVTAVANYKITRRYSVSGTMTYSTGRPITLPVAQYQYGNSTRVFYSDRNAYRIPDYFRTDVSLNVDTSHKLKKLAHSSWSFSVYNLLGRANVYSVFFVAEKGEINGYQLSIFSKPILTATYNFRM
ncbi:MAG: TonB-dependent receptor [Bacteroidia bacterium]|nr:TonB-dependent receptor [Bacteroidia bacterium]